MAAHLSAARIVAELLAGVEVKMPSEDVTFNRAQRVHVPSADQLVLDVE